MSTTPPTETRSAFRHTHAVTVSLDGWADSCRCTPVGDVDAFVAALVAKRWPGTVGKPVTITVRGSR